MKKRNIILLSVGIIVFVLTTMIVMFPLVLTEDYYSKRGLYQKAYEMSKDDKEKLYLESAAAVASNLIKKKNGGEQFELINVWYGELTDYGENREKGLVLQTGSYTKNYWVYKITGNTCSIVGNVSFPMEDRIFTYQELITNSSEELEEMMLAMTVYRIIDDGTRIDKNSIENIMYQSKRGLLDKAEMIER